MTNQEAIEKLKELLFMTGYKESLDLAIKALEDRPQGEWEKPFEMNGKTYHKCNYCHISSQLILIDKFCPNCGAKMLNGCISVFSQVQEF